jgi:hypothetical protein
MKGYADLKISLRSFIDDAKQVTDILVKNEKEIIYDGSSHINSNLHEEMMSSINIIKKKEKKKSKKKKEDLKEQDVTVAEDSKGERLMDKDENVKELIKQKRKRDENNG